MDVDRIWAGWRLAYVTDADGSYRGPDQCPFCSIPLLPAEESLIVERGRSCYTVLNLYPYNSGHLMVIPYRHVAELDELAADEAGEVMRLTRRAIVALKDEYRPDGFNLGANIGSAAGAGLPRHFHMHVLPRWSGDTNYVTVLGGVKVMPEELADTAGRMRAALERLGDDEPGE